MPLLSIAGHCYTEMLFERSVILCHFATLWMPSMVGALGQASTDSLTGLLEQFAENEIEISSGN